jgi:hypothetical protein
MDIESGIDTAISIGARLGLALLALVIGYVLAVVVRRLANRL